jgi:two-component system, LytTR family, response regulator
MKGRINKWIFQMDILKIVVADDDASSRILLHHFIRFLPQYKVVGEAISGEEFVRLVLEEKPDIALVDIKMPDLDGKEAVKICKQSLPALQVIFTTGYDEFAVKAFEIAATDYIVKPIERTRLFHALEKARKLIELSRQDHLSIKNEKQKTWHQIAQFHSFSPNGRHFVCRKRKQKNGHSYCKRTI